MQGSSTRGSQVIDPPHKAAKRQIQVRHHEELDALAHVAARLGDGQKSLFFCESRKTSEAVASAMVEFGTTVWVHHSSVSAEERRIAEDAFHGGKDVCIACTSTLELGIDVGDLDRVLQHEAPGTVSSFMQRMGRTGRRKEAVANTTFLCQSDEAVWVSLALVRLARQGWVEDVGVQTRCWPIMVHQLLAMALADNGVAPDTAWAHFRRVPDVRDITRAEFERLIAWMVRQTALQLIAGRLVLGHQAEQRFGKRNFLDLYAVFESPASYGVETMRGAPLGSLEQSFVDRLIEGSSVFRLGGRGWMVQAVEHRKRVVKVTPAGGGKAPTWSGFGARLMGERLCTEVEALLRDNTAPKTAHATALDVLTEARERFAPVFERDNLEWSHKGLTWWTFAGGRINTTLARAFAAVEPTWRVVTGNFSVRFEGDDVTEGSWHAALLRISDIEFWEDAQLWHEIGRTLPNYRLSKFQQFMPPWVAREMVAGFLLDIEGAALWLLGKNVAAPDWSSSSQASVDAVKPARPEARRTPPVSDAARPSNPVTWVDTAAGLQAVCDMLSKASRIGLDVETTLSDQALCLVQIANETHTWLIDPLAIDDLTPLAQLMENPDVAKVIHNATFEKRVLKRHGMQIINITDTLKVSRAVRSVRGKGTHTLATVCRRELGVGIDKECQTSDWRRRPLTDDQLRYAALDAEILLRVLDALPEPPQGSLFG
jgi:ATP-dependent Lhr-like helicase